MMKRCRRLLEVAWWLVVGARVAAAGIACLSNPCLHGICIDDINSTYSCYCVDGYTGVLCQTNWDECWSNPCENGGTCLDGIASYNCTCPDGFVGENCETNYDECESNPCQNNGTCIDLTNGYVCSCVPGYSGQHCDLDIAVCNSSEEVRCYNGGQCIEGPGFKFYCKCLPGWGGSKCDDPVDECQSNPCRNGGVCIDMHADYMCACNFGFTGKSCEIELEFCNENACSNNALCVVEDGAKVCYCVPDYHGERCEQQYDECLIGPGCMNGGTCIDGVDNFTCSCPPRLTGALCECLILDDNTLDCEYVSPTFPPSTTQSVMLTTIHEQMTTTDLITIPLHTSSGYNDSIPRHTTLSFTETDSKTTTHKLIVIETTRTEITTDSESVTEVSTIPKIINETSEITTAKTEIVTFIQPTSDIIQTGNESHCKNCSIFTTETTTVVTPPESEITTRLLKPDDLATEYELTEDTTILKEFTTEIMTVPSTMVWDKKDVPAETTTTSKSMVPKIDDVTEKMFTESPSEYPVSEYTTVTSIYANTTIMTTTEVFDTVTGLDNITTVPSECSESICNNHGNCFNTPQGIRCHCKFNFGGRFCDEKLSITTAAFSGNSYISHKIRNTTSIYIEFEAKTLIDEGQIMYADISEGVYMQLYIKTGLLKFKFSCGYQTMLLSELKTFVNKGYRMKVETRLDLDVKNQHCNATLHLNDTVAMSGGQVANISVIENDIILYLGNPANVKDIENKAFVGCITNLTVNGETRDIFSDAMEASEITECTSLWCLSGPCLHGGSCADRLDTYTCACTNGWMGDHCEMSICEHNPCHSGGRCVPHPASGFLCLCPYGKHGILCEYNIDITRPSLSPLAGGVSSFVVYPLSPSAINSERFDLRLRFQTDDMNQISLLAFIGQSGRHDSHSQHLAVTFVKGYVMLTWNMGSGPRRIFTPRPLSARRSGHSLRVSRRGRAAWLAVDGRFNVSGNAPGNQLKMTTTPYIYIGGHPSANFEDLPHDLPLHAGWRGCAWEAAGAAAGAALHGRGVGQCAVAQCTANSCNAPNGACIHSPATYGCICNEGWLGVTCSVKQNPCDRGVTKCQGRCVVTAAGDSQCDCPYGRTGLYCETELYPTDVLFTGVRSYVRLRARPVGSASLSLAADVRALAPRGLLLHTETRHFYTALSLQGAVLEYRWIDRVSGVTSVVRSGVVLSLREWHAVRAGRYGSRLYVWVDGAISTDAMLAHAYPHTAANTSLVLGGAADLSSVPWDAMPGPTEPFTGCIRNLQLDNVLLPLEKQNIEEGQNIADCDGTACGAELCGGGACVLERGRATCTCAGGTAAAPAGDTGARCRRNVPCKAAECAPPRGVCRKGACVCSAGHAGTNCQQNITVSIPQFGGDSLLSVLRKPLSGRVGEQRAFNISAPHHVLLNFSTAAEDGLVLFITMDKNYIALGLEKGYLKVVWTKCNEANSNNLEKMGTEEDNESKKEFSKVLLNAGFMSDAEWHVLALKLARNNFTVYADEKMILLVEFRCSSDAGKHYDTDLFIGGIPVGSFSAARRHFPQNFKGCIDNISADKIEPSITNYKDIYSENILSCQLPIT